MLHVNLILILIVIRIVHMSFASSHHLRQCVHDVTLHVCVCVCISLSLSLSLYIYLYIYTSCKSPLAAIQALHTVKSQGLGSNLSAATCDTEHPNKASLGDADLPADVSPPYAWVCAWQ